jgi:hypothetical protein
VPGVLVCHSMCHGTRVSVPFLCHFGLHASANTCKRAPSFARLRTVVLRPPARVCELLEGGRDPWAGEDSNLRLTDYESAALTAELPAPSGTTVADAPSASATWRRSWAMRWSSAPGRRVMAWVIATSSSAPQSGRSSLPARPPSDLPTPRQLSPARRGWRRRRRRSRRRCRRRTRSARRPRRTRARRR